VMTESAGEIAPDVAVAPNASVPTAGNAGMFTWKVCAPAPEPSTALTLAWPRLSVTTVVSAGEPPAGARNRTPTPATGKLSAARTPPVSGSGSACPTAPPCPLPETATSCVGSGWNVARTESVTPLGVRARTQMSVREAPPGAFNVPVPLTFASAVSLVVQDTYNCGTRVPPWNPCT